MKASFAKKLTAGFLFVAFVTLLITAGILTPRLQSAFHHQLEQSLAAEVAVLADSFAYILPPSGKGLDAVWKLTERASRQLNCRVTVIDPEGVVLADSERTPAEVQRMDNHGARPEVRAALNAGVGESVRHSATLDKDMMYIATPVPGAEPAGKRGVVRVALSLAEVDRRLAEVRSDLYKAGCIAALVAIVVALISVRKINQPLTDLMSMAEDVGRGNYAPALTVTSRDEFGRLAATIADMAASIEEKVMEVTQERTQLAAILSALVESVIALDHKGAVLLLNPAAERLFGVRSDEVKGRPFLEALRHGALTQLFERTLQQQNPQTEEITLHGADRVLSAHAVPVRYDETRTGVLAALHDITELRRLERVRQEFVANASHELKTPLTSIQGFAETLLDGAIDDPKHSRSFVETIQEQANRLRLLIEDLLDLSAIEAKRTTYHFEAVALQEAVDRVFRTLGPVAKAKQVRLESTLATDLPPVRADREKLNQILQNLIDNAVKFNRAQGHVTVTAVAHERSVEVSVQDTGLGIPPENLARVFERFFRGDKSHSKEIPGTGLGLAIVKHLVEAHQGAVCVESTYGQGATFRFTLPRAS